MADKLRTAIDNVNIWHAKEKAAGHSTSHRCLEAVRASLLKVGLKLPPSSGTANTALDCFKRLSADPAKWGWVQIHSPLPDEPCLCFYGGCGILADGRVAGHIALVADGMLYANDAYKDGPYWAGRIKGAFVPAK